MTAEQTAAGWERSLNDVGTRSKAEAQRILSYLNDEVVPRIRRDGASALRVTASSLLAFAQRLDDPDHGRSQAKPAPQR